MHPTPGSKPSTKRVGTLAFVEFINGRPYYWAAFPALIVFGRAVQDQKTSAKAMATAVYRVATRRAKLLEKHVMEFMPTMSTHPKSSPCSMESTSPLCFLTHR
jgi:hypothetical protein